jgi:hypothetical protein
VEFPRVRFTVRRLMVIVAFLALSIAAFRLVNDPLEKFHRRTGLRRPIGAELITSGHDQTFDGEPEFRLETISILLRGPEPVHSAIP